MKSITIRSVASMSIATVFGFVAYLPGLAFPQDAKELSPARSRQIAPTIEQWRSLSEAAVKGPIVMVNLVKFKKQGGAEKYVEYVNAFRQLKRPGSAFHQAELLFDGVCKQLLIGDQEWDRILLIKWPSKNVFIVSKRGLAWRAALTT